MLMIALVPLAFQVFGSRVALDIRVLKVKRQTFDPKPVMEFIDEQVRRENFRYQIQTNFLTRTDEDDLLRGFNPELFDP